MKVAFVADVHVGNFKRFGGAFRGGMNDRCRIVIRTLAEAVRTARDEGCCNLVVLGDLFDTTKPTPQMIRAVQRAFGDDGFVIVIKGNHDSESSDKGDHALGPLRPVCKIVESSIVLDTPSCELLCVPFQEGPAIRWFPDEVLKLTEKHPPGKRTRILAFHLGIEDEETKFFLQGAPDSVPVDLLLDLMDDCKIDFCYAGNWHDHRYWSASGGRRIVQVGTLCPTGWKDPGIEGFGFVSIVHTGLRGNQSVQNVEIPGPRFLTEPAASFDEYQFLGLKEHGHSVYVRFTANSEEWDEASRVVDVLVEAGTIAGGDPHRQDIEQEAAARTAAHSAKSADSLAEAVFNYVEHMPLEPVSFDDITATADRGNVLANVSKRLNL